MSSNKFFPTREWKLKKVLWFHLEGTSSLKKCGYSLQEKSTKQLRFHFTGIIRRAHAFSPSSTSMHDVKNPNLLFLCFSSSTLHLQKTLQRFPPPFARTVGKPLAQEAQRRALCLAVPLGQTSIAAGAEEEGQEVHRLDQAQRL